jgi:hypothetical protein
MTAVFLDCQVITNIVQLGEVCYIINNILI